MKRWSRRHLLQGSLVLTGVGLLGGCAWLRDPAERTSKVHRLGFLSGGAAALNTADLDAFRHGLREMGYAEGRDFTLETRYAEGQLERSPELAAELVRLPVDLIVAVGTAPARAARDATGTIPVVLVQGDAVGFGLVDNLARPGRNVTGLTGISTQLNGKRLDLLKEVLPGIARVAILWNPAIPERAAEFPDAEAAARALGLHAISLEVREAGELATAFETASRLRAEALLTLNNTVLGTNRTQLVGLATKGRLPMMSAGRDYVDAGGLMGYGPNNRDQHLRAAVFVDKILKGARPGDLPIEQPNTFDFVVNLKTAQTLGLTIPQSVLQQATEIIQ